MDADNGDSVDHETALLIHRVIKDHFHRCTIIEIVHMLDMIEDYDKVAVMQGGKVVEFDAPKVLLSRPSALRSLYNARQYQSREDVISPA